MAWTEKSKREFDSWMKQEVEWMHAEYTHVQFLLLLLSNKQHPSSNLLSSRKRRLTRHSRLHRNNLP
jgi:hypothetical protein